MSAVVNVWCGQCSVWSKSYFTQVVVNIWCGECSILHTVWWMSSLVNVCVIEGFLIMICLFMYVYKLQNTFNFDVYREAKCVVRPR